MTVGEAVAIATLALTVLALPLAGWWRIEARVGRAELQARRDLDALKRDHEIAIKGALAAGMLAQSELAEHKVHVAQTYASKTGVTDAMDRLEHAITRLSDEMRAGIDGMTARMDRLYDVRQSARGGAAGG